MFNLVTKSFHISWDIVFHEETFPFHQKATSPMVHDMFLDEVIPQPVFEPSPLVIKNIPNPLAAGYTSQSHASPLPLRCSQMTSKPPLYLADYQCNNAVIIEYPIVAHLSYARLSPPCLEYVNNTIAIYEPKFYH